MRRYENEAIQTIFLLRNIGKFTDNRHLLVNILINDATVAQGFQVQIMKRSATISGDIFSYTALNEKDKRLIESLVKSLIGQLTERYQNENFYGRVIKGDAIEIALNKPKPALRIALLLKTLVKSIAHGDIKSDDSRLKHFIEHGVRIAVAVAPLNVIDPDKGIIDGEAIYLSGRKIKNLSTFDKKKIIIKNTLFFSNPEKAREERFETIFVLLDAIIARCSAKQCEVIHHKLMGLSESEVSQKLGKSQSTISQHSNAAGWQAIETAVHYFEKYI